MAGCCRISSAVVRAVLSVVVFGIADDSARGEGQSVFVTSPSQPMNVGDAIAAAAAYHDSGAYDKDVALVARQAAAWVAERAAAVQKPAVVFDIDETALANWEVIKRDNFGRPIAGPCDLALDGPCGWAAWDQLSADPAIGPTLEVFRVTRMQMPRYSLLLAAPKTSGRRPNVTCARPATRASRNCTWCRPGPSTHRPPTSRRRCGPRSKRRATRSSLMLAISRRTFSADILSESSCSRTRSTEFLDAGPVSRVSVWVILQRTGRHPKQQFRRH